MDLAPLPTAAQELLLDGSLKALMGIRDTEPHALKSTLLSVPKQVLIRLLGFLVHGLDGQHLAGALPGDPHHHKHRKILAPVIHPDRKSTRLNSSHYS
mgnify:CR=1 FL=1